MVLPKIHANELSTKYWAHLKDLFNWEEENILTLSQFQPWSCKHFLLRLGFLFRRVFRFISERLDALMISFMKIFFIWMKIMNRYIYTQNLSTNRIRGKIEAELIWNLKSSNHYPIWNGVKNELKPKWKWGK